MWTAAADDIARLGSEIVRLGRLVDAAGRTDRDVRLERALIVQHAWALLELELRAPNVQPQRVS